MFLYDSINNSMVCDFQLVYETDCNFMYDLYAYAQEIEPLILSCDVKVNKIDHGLILIDKKDYKVLCERIEEITRSFETSLKISREMVAKIKLLIDLCNEAEKNYLNDGKFSKYNTIAMVKALINVISYRRIADSIADAFFDNVENVICPSYLNILNKNYNALGELSSEEDIDRFIWEYGFLYSFSIKETEYENKCSLRKKIKSNLSNVGKVKRFDPLYECKRMGGVDEIVYNISWYNEYKHVYQLRVLRNLRYFMVERGLSIIQTGVKELYYV